jgi:hypothetical protein
MMGTAESLGAASLLDHRARINNHKLADRHGINKRTILEPRKDQQGY